MGRNTQYNLFYIVLHTPHHGMARPLATDGDDLQIWRVEANIQNEQSRTAEKRWSSSVGLTHRKESLLRNTTRGSESLCEHDPFEVWKLNVNFALEIWANTQYKWDKLKSRLEYIANLLENVGAKHCNTILWNLSEELW